MPLVILTVIIIPTMMLANSVFIGISSRPVDENSPMFRLMRKVYPETGKPVIRTRIFGTVCDRCRRQGNRECGHELEDSWSSQKQSRKVSILLQDQKDVYLREMRNEEVATNIEPAFPPDKVQALNNTKRDYGGSEEQRYVWVAIDSAAGGKQSKYAIVSMIRPVIRDKSLPGGKRQDIVVRIFPFYSTVLWGAVQQWENKSVVRT